MLEKESVVNGTMGSELAKFLIEFLPFEEHQKAIIDSVRLVLQPGLITDEMREEIWQRGKRKNVYYIGFLQQTPNELPIKVNPHKQWQHSSEKLQAEINQGNEIAELLYRALSPVGQAFLQTVEEVLTKPNDQDAVAAILNAIGEYFNKFDNESHKWRDIQSLADYAEEHYQEYPQVRQLLTLDSSIQPQLKALFNLSMINETLVDPIFGMTDAIGSVMRKKIEPVITPIIEQIHTLR
jgi:hypothetical protein